MRKLDTSAVSNTVGLPVKSGSLIHIQNSYVEAIAEMVKGFIGPTYDPTKLYILQGMVNTGTAPTYTINAGSCFFNGEVYLCDGATFTLTGSNVAICDIATTFFTAPNADGVQFTDGIVRNIHQVRKVVITQALAGSGIANYVSAVRINTNIPQLNLTNGTGTTVTGTYPNLQVNTSVINPIIQAGNIYLGDINTSGSLDAYTSLLSGGGSGQAAYKYTWPVAIGHTNYVVVLVVEDDNASAGTDFNNNYMCITQVGKRTATDMTFAVMTTATGNTQTLMLKYIVFACNIFYP